MFVDICCTLFQTLGQPIQARFQESEERPRAFEELGKQIQQYMKTVHAFKAKVFPYLISGKCEEVGQIFSEFKGSSFKQNAGTASWLLSS